MRPAPAHLFDPATRTLALGSYIGPLPRTSFDDVPLVTRIVRRKKWVYLAIASRERWLSLGVVRTGYAGTAFAYVFDRDAKRMLFDRAVVGVPGSASVTDDAHADGLLARFAFGRSNVLLERRGDVCALRARLGELDLAVSLDESASPPPICAIAELGPSLVSATEKRVLADVTGDMRIAGQRTSLDGAFAGYDYSHGLMPRRTRWNWAFAMGYAKDGRRVAFNVTEGFVGEAECAAFVDDRVVPLKQPRFALDRKATERPWQLSGPEIDLTFDVGAVHAQRTNLLLVRSRFLQPVGAFRGRLVLDGQDVELDGVPGVVEDQDVVW